MRGTSNSILYPGRVTSATNGGSMASSEIS